MSEITSTAPAGLQR